MDMRVDVGGLKRARIRGQEGLRRYVEVVGMTMWLNGTVVG